MEIKYYQVFHPSVGLNQKCERKYRWKCLTQIIIANKYKERETMIKY